MESAGQKLKRARERLGLRYRDVEQASLSIAQRHNNDDYALVLSRLSDIENKGIVPSIYRIYSLCAIYRLDPGDVLAWYGVNIRAIAADAAAIEVENTHPIGFRPDDSAGVTVPLALDPGFDLRKTAFLSRMIQRWGTVPLLLLNRIDVRHHRYAYIGTEDWSMYPIVQPGAVVVIDTAARSPETAAWASEHERPIFFIEFREGFACGWCTLDKPAGTLTLQPHPSSGQSPVMYQYPNEAEIVGRVTSVAMRLSQGQRRRIRS